MLHYDDSKLEKMYHIIRIFFAERLYMYKIMHIIKKNSNVSVTYDLYFTQEVNNMNTCISFVASPS